VEAGIERLPRAGLADQFFRFAIAGVIATAFDVGTLAALKDGLGLHYLIGNAAGFIVGNFVSYVSSVRWVFSNRTVSRRSMEFAAFSLIGIGGLTISEGCMVLGVDVAGQHYLLAKVFAVGATLAWNFGLKKFLLFRDVSRP
jgi:putative flippase GtrA